MFFSLQKCCFRFSPILSKVRAQMKVLLPFQLSQGVLGTQTMILFCTPDVERAPKVAFIVFVARVGHDKNERIHSGSSRLGCVAAEPSASASPRALHRPSK